MTAPRRYRVLDQVRTADRAIVAVIGAFNLYFAWFVWTGPATAGVPLERWWALVFAGAGVACAALEVVFLNREVLAWSGALTAVAYGSRAMVLFVGLTTGRLRLAEARVQAGVAIWVALTACVAYVWLRVLRPLLELRRIGA